MFYSVFQAPTASWPPSLFYQTPLPERIKDFSVKNWTQLAGSGPVPWRQAPSLFNSPMSHTELRPKVPYEVELTMDRINASERLVATTLEKRKVEDFSERLVNGGLKTGSREIPENGNAGLSHFPASNMLIKNVCWVMAMLLLAYWRKWLVETAYKSSF